MHRVRKATWALALAVLAATAYGPGAFVRAQETQYKIGVFDLKGVLDANTQLQSEMKALNAEKDAAQAALDNQLKALRARKDEYTKNRASLSQDQRDAQETELNRELMKLETDFKTKQNDLDAKTARLIRNAGKLVEDTVASFAQEGNYHLVLRKDGPAVAYSADAIDITSALATRVNQTKAQ